MSKKHPLKSADASASAPAGSPKSPPANLSEPHVSPEIARQVTLGLLLALTGFLVLRLFFLAYSAAPWDDAGAIDTISRNPAKLSPAVLMRQWSYAPAQFYLTEQLVKFARDYTTLLFWGRLPSLLAWYGGLLLAFWAFREVLGKAHLMLSATLTLWTAVTLRGLVESSQGYNYACGLPCSVLLLWLFVSPRGHAWLTETKRLWIPGGAGLAAGMACWFTYQSLFIAMGGFLMLGVIVVWRRQFAALKSILIAGIAFSAVFGWVYITSLKYVQSRGIGWAGGVPGDSLAERLKFLPTAWFKVIESNFSVALPSVGSVAIAGAVVALVVAGLVCLARSKRWDAVEARALWFLVLVATIWTALAYLEKSPLSASRHTYILQFPLMICLGVALKHLNVPRRIYAIGAAVIVAGFAVGAPAFWRSVENRFDEPGITKLLTENPNSVLLQYPGGSSLDMFLLFREHPEWQQRVVDGTWQWPAFMQQLSSAPAYVSIYTYGIQEPIREKDVAAAKAAGFRVVPLQNIAPVGSVEPWRKDQYVGNGFHLYKLEKSP